MKRVVDIKVVKGEPTDGTGLVCIHLFVQDETGLIVEPHVLHMRDIKDRQGRVNKGLVAEPTRGRLACDPNRLVEPVTHNRVTTITMRTDDPRAVTCPKCCSSVDYVEKMKVITALEAGK